MSLISGECSCTLSPAPLLIVPTESLITYIYHFVLLVFPRSLSRAYIMIHALFSTYGDKSRFLWSNRHFIHFGHVGYPIGNFWCHLVFIPFRQCITVSACLPLRYPLSSFDEEKKIFHVVHYGCGSSLACENIRRKWCKH